MEKVLGRSYRSLTVFKGVLKERWRGTPTESKSSVRTRIKGFILKEGKFKLDTREKFYETCEALNPSLEMFKASVDRALSNLVHMEGIHVHCKGF